MISLFRNAALVSVLLVSGCYVSVESATRFEGTPVKKTLDYTSGQAVHIVSNNGNVNVVGGSSSTSISVKFQPFILEKDDNADGAKEQMEHDLVMTAEVRDNGDIVFSVIRHDGSSGNLGGDIDVTLPAGFDGAFEVDQNNGQVKADLRGGLPLATDIDSENGSIEILGAAGPLSIVAGNGSGTVDVAAWPSTGTGEGKVALGNGDLDFSLPADASGTMTAFASNGVVSDGSIPTTWTSDESGPGSKSYTMNGGAGGLVAISTDLGDISISAR
jgi:hypothetical protein